MLSGARVHASLHVFASGTQKDFRGRCAGEIDRCGAAERAALKDTGLAGIGAAVIAI